MAKHPHRLILMHSKTWKCTLPGCNFFVHLGLAYVLLGKQGICWECTEQFTIDSQSLQEEQPRCPACRGVISIPQEFHTPRNYTTTTKEEENEIEVIEPEEVPPTVTEWDCGNCGKQYYTEVTICPNCKSADIHKFG